MRGGFHSTGSYEVPQVVDCVSEENAFFDLQRDTVAFEKQEDLTATFDVSLGLFREYHYVVQVYESVLPFHAFQDDICSLLKGFSGIL